MAVRIILISLLFFLFAAPFAIAADPPSPSGFSSSFNAFFEPREVSGHIRFTYEEIDMPDPGESRLGLFGFSFLGDLKYGFYAGLAGYGALRGERGGFFTGGLTGGKTFHLVSRLHADVGLFGGGGGGGAAPQGGGLMLRGHAGLLLDLDNVRIGASVSRVEFPNGDIESNQVALNIDVPFAFLAAKGPDAGKVRQPRDLSTPFGTGQQDIFIKAQNYTPVGSSRNTSGNALRKDIQLLGFEYRSYLEPGPFWLLESSGALGGDVDGYAEVLFGMGYHKQWGSHPAFGLEAALSAGGAGGGRVDTGGGAVGRARLGINTIVAEKYVMAVEGSYLDTLDGGHFSAYSLGARLGWRMHAPVKNGVFSLKGEWGLDRWELAAEHQSYLDPHRKTSADEQDVHLISLQFRRYFNDSNVYLSGQAAGAYEGDAGGYASGLVGPGYRWPVKRDASFSCRAELLFGAGGGGGLDVGSGILLQPTIGLSYRPAASVSAGLTFGHVLAPDGDLDSHTIGLNLSMPFILPNK